jgi:hypothetical protein
MATEPANWHTNAQILKTMFNSGSPVYDSGPEGKSGKHRINVEILLLNDLKVRREVEYIFIEDPYGLVIDAKVLGNPFPCEPYELEQDISHHIEKLHLTKVSVLEIKVKQKAS